MILTKCYGYVGEDPGLRTILYGKELPQLKDYSNQGGLSRAAIFNAVNKSLARLETDYIDLLQIHRFDKNTPIEETMEALHDLVKSGKVRYIGASSMWAVEFAQMQFVAEKNGWTKFVSMQNHYNLLYREEEREMNRFCNSTGVGLIPASNLVLRSFVGWDANMDTVGPSLSRPSRSPRLGLWIYDSLCGRERESHVYDWTAGGGSEDDRACGGAGEET